MVKALINGIFGVFFDIASIFTAPISNAISNILPDVATFITAITNLLNLIINLVPYFWYLIPPISRTIIYLMFGFWLGLQPFHLVYTGVMNMLNFSKRINIFTSK